MVNVSTNNILLQAIAGLYEGELPDPQSNNGKLLKYIAENGIMGGTPEEWEFTLDDGSTVTKIVSAGKTLWESIKWIIIYGDSPAYDQTVPAEARPDCKVNKIGGHSEVINGELVSTISKKIMSKSVDGNTLDELVTDYGVLRSAGNVYDYVDLDRAVIVRRVGAIDLGTLTNWTYNTDPLRLRFQANVNGMKPNSDITVLPNGICSKYLPDTIENVYRHVNDKRFAIHNTTNVIWIYDTDYTDATVFKTAMSGVMLYYELTTPVEEPITVKGNTLTVESGGTLTFVNDTDYHFPVPNEVEYYVHMD